MFTVDNSYGPYYCDCGNYLTDDSRLTNNILYMPDNYEFIPVTDETALTSEHHGYGFMDPETLNYTNYALRYNHNSREEFLNVDADGLLKVTKGAKDYYELDVHYAYDNQCGCDFMPAVEFGYGAGIVDANSGKTLQQLVRQRYTLKLKDVNLIDNDTTYVAMNRTLGANGYYITKGIKEIRRGGATLSSFYLKNDQIYGDSTCYALIDTRVTNCFELWDGYRRASVIDGNGHLEYNDLNNGPNTPVSAFALEINDRPLYRSIPETSVNFFRTIGTVNQKLFHDATNATGASAVIDRFGYLGLAQEDMAANEDMKNIFVEPLRGYNYRMPQYMLAIERDTVADGLWCNTNTHGYFADLEDAEASKEDVSHVVFYNGYTADRFLVNLQDSVTVGSHAYHKLDLFTYNGYAVRS
ncbi:MAG: hypothetical protein LUG65_00620 [Clostridiales bacterium]|nr:hypothetical protein [Clostridiales bacterium]